MRSKDSQTRIKSLKQKIDVLIIECDKATSFERKQNRINRTNKPFSKQTQELIDKFNDTVAELKKEDFTPLK